MDLWQEYGAGGETRTLMDRSPGDFESPASTNFTTPARRFQYKRIQKNVKKKVMQISQAVTSI